MRVTDERGNEYRVTVVADLDGMTGAVGPGVVYVEDAGSDQANIERAREVLAPPNTQTRAHHAISTTKA